MIEVVIWTPVFVGVSLAQSVPGAKAGDSLENPKDGQQYAWIPPGNFMSGCLDRAGTCSSEPPPGLKTIKDGFWIGKTEVTVGTYKRFASVIGGTMPPASKWLGRELNPGWRYDQMPIVNVTWHEAESFCNWAGGKLPSEMQWEYAARSGDDAVRHVDLDTVAWYADNSGQAVIDSTSLGKPNDARALAARLFENGDGPHAVALKLPNAWGLYDMLGNLWEWTSDHYSPGEPSLALRGGSWSNVPRLIGVSVRGRAEPLHRSNSIGFRCVLGNP